MDAILIGGAMACTFFKAMGLEVGNSLVEDDRVEMAAALLGRASGKLVLPVGAVVAPLLPRVAAIIDPSAESGPRTRIRDGPNTA